MKDETGRIRIKALGQTCDRRHETIWSFLRDKDAEGLWVRRPRPSKYQGDRIRVPYETAIKLIMEHLGLEFEYEEPKPSAGPIKLVKKA